jgi:ABC-type multidrug transport system permease subunit
MPTREKLISEFLIILIGGFLSITITSFLAFACLKFYQSFNGRFSKKIANDVERESLESWETKDS